MVAAQTAGRRRPNRWLAAGWAAIALGLAFGLAGLIVGLTAINVSCDLPYPPALRIASLFVAFGALLQLVPIAMGLVARRRWRTTVLIARFSLTLAGLELAAFVWPPLIPVVGGRLAVAVVLFGLFGLAALALGFWLRHLARRGDTFRPLTTTQANLLMAGAATVSMAAFFGGESAIALMHFCLRF